MDFPNLTEETRDLMLKEIDSDVEAKRIYISDRLNPKGKELYPALLRAAAKGFDDSWLTTKLNLGGLLNPTYSRMGRQVKMPVHAAQVLAEGEFNRYYIRAVCKIAITKVYKLQVVKIKQVNTPREESEKLVGKFVEPDELYQDLISNIGVPPKMGIPAGPGSELSVKLVE